MRPFRSNKDELSNKPIVYRIKKNGNEAHRKDKRKKDELSDEINSLGITAKKIVRKHVEQDATTKNIDIHIGNVNTYNIYLNTESNHNTARDDESESNSGSNSAFDTKRKRFHTTKNSSQTNGTNPPGIRKKAVKQPNSNTPVHSGTLPQDPKNNFKIAKVRKNNLIPKEKEETTPHSGSFGSLSSIPSRFKMYQPPNNSKKDRPQSPQETRTFPKQAIKSNITTKIQ